jgi:hypothetical protein
VPDGIRLARDLRAAQPGEPAAWAIPTGEERAAVQEAANAFVAWYGAVYDTPASNAPSSGDDARMEYHFSIDASATDTPCAFVADQCTGDPLDWPSFDRVSSAIGPVTAPPAAVTRTLVPAPVTFKGMAARRYWQLERGVYCESDFLERTRLAARSISRPTIPRTRTGGPQL